MDETPHSERYGYADGYVWQAPEYFHREKTSDWFWGLGIVTLTLVVISVLYDNLIFGIFLIVAAFTLALFAHRPPRIVTVEINPHGIILEKVLYRYAELESFWVREEDLHPKVLVKSKKKLMPYIAVPLPNPEELPPEVIRDYLFGFLKEEMQEEPPIQRLMEYLGF